MSTPAIQFLKQRQIQFDLVKYDHEEKGAAFAAKATGFPLQQIVKTLVVELGEKQYVLVLIPGDQHLSLKRLAKVCGVKRAAIADTKTAERLTGYLVGGISPFATKQKLAVIMEECILNFDKILINAGQRGMMLKLTSKDIRATLTCTVASIAHQ
jgi:Cys-tRNA(Pro)/Cys-tRNA(Cys) deacylase